MIKLLKALTELFGNVNVQINSADNLVYNVGKGSTHFEIILVSRTKRPDLVHDYCQLMTFINGTCIKTDQYRENEWSKVIPRVKSILEVQIIAEAL